MDRQRRVTVRMQVRGKLGPWKEPWKVSEHVISATLPTFAVASSLLTIKSNCSNLSVSIVIGLDPRLYDPFEKSPLYT